MEKTVPNNLRNWFILHFWLDIVFAAPLFFAPDFTAKLLGWQVVDPYTARIAAAAVIGIAWSLIEGAQGRPWGAWLILAIFVVFNIVWITWRKKLE